MNSINFSDQLKEDIRANVPIEDVAALLGLELTGNPPAGHCPSGHLGKSGRSFTLNVKENYFHCWACGIGGDNIRLVETVLNLEFREALRWMIERYRPADLAYWERSSEKHPPKNDGKSGEYFTAADLYEKVYQYGRRLLYEPAGKEALDYLLTARGYNRETLEKTEWIYYPPDADIRKHLREAAGADAAEAIKSLHLQGAHGDLFRAALPWRDRRGRIIGFFKRAAVPEGVIVETAAGLSEKRRQEYTAGLSTTADLFNLHYCRKKKAVVIVEGPPDAAYLSRLDLGAGVGIAAVGQGGLSEKHLDGLRALGIKQVIISFDNDEHGPKNTAAAIERLRKSGAGFDVFVIDPPDLGRFKDPDELFRAEGVDPFRALIAGAASWFNWEFRRAQKTHPADTDQGAVAFHHTVDRIFSKLSPAEFRQLKKMNPEDFEPGAGWEERFADIREQEAARRQEKAAKEAINKYQGGNKSLDDLRDLRDRLTEISQQEAAGGELDGPYTFADYEKSMQSEPDAMKTGYNELDRIAPVTPGAITIIAGRPSHGKTTFLLNLMMQQAAAYPDKHFFFFSYEQTKNQLMTRLLMREANLVLDPYGNNYTQYKRYIKYKNQDEPAIEAARRRLADFDNRIFLIDERYTVEQLTGVLAQLAKRHRIGAVYIDYIQKIGTKIKSYSRQTELQTISNQLLDRALSLKIPVIMGAQFNRESMKPGRTQTADKKRKPITEDYIREAGDIEQDANLILGLWDDRKEGGKEDGLAVYVLKNRDGEVHHEPITLNYSREVYRISDAKESPEHSAGGNPETADGEVYPWDRD